MYIVVLVIAWFCSVNDQTRLRNQRVGIMLVLLCHIPRLHHIVNLRRGLFMDVELLNKICP